jgi:hypothetical protein
MEDASRNVQGFGQRQEQFSNRGRVLGVAYDSPAVIPDGSDPPAATNPVIDYIPTARPGSRAPHLWLRRSGEVISTIDLYDTSFVLLTGAAGRAWTAAAERVAPQLGIPLISYVVGQEGDLVDQPNAWPSLYGVGPDGAVLVRPDGHVAWRAATAVSDARRELAAVLRRVVSLNPETNPLMVST